jgi:hypothetical protein
MVSSDLTRKKTTGRGWVGEGTILKAKLDLKTGAFSPIKLGMMFFK